MKLTPSSYIYAYGYYPDAHDCQVGKHQKSKRNWLILFEIDFDKGKIDTIFAFECLEAMFDFCGKTSLLWNDQTENHFIPKFSLNCNYSTNKRIEHR